MPRFPKEKIDEQYKKLPDALKDAIFSVDVASKIFDIGKKFALTIEETGFLGEEAGYVMLGLVHPNDFAKSTQARINIDEEEIQQIAKEVNTQVFYPIRELFKQAHRVEIPEEKPKETVSSPKTFEKMKEEIKEEEKKEFPSSSKPVSVIKPIPAQQAQPVSQKPSTEPSPAVKPVFTAPPKSSGPPRPFIRPVTVEKLPVAPPTEKKEYLTPLVIPPKPELQPAPPLLTQRIPPIDLRKTKPEMIRGVILNSPPQPPRESGIGNRESGKDATQKLSEAKSVVRKNDPYREAAE